MGRTIIPPKLRPIPDGVLEYNSPIWHWYRELREAVAAERPYGEMYTDDNSLTVTTTVGDGSTFYQLTGLTLDGDFDRKLNDPKSANNTVVGTDSSDYACIVAHTAAAANKPITGGSYSSSWRLADGDTTGVTWASGIVYQPTSVVTPSADAFLIGNGGKGVYEMMWNASWTSDVNNTVCHCAMHRTPSGGAAAKIVKSSIERKIGTAGDLGAAAGGCYLLLNEGDKVDLRFASDKAGAVLSVNHCNFRIKLIRWE